MDIGNKIQAIRTDHGMTQAEFADKFHVTRQTVSNWENNKNYPDLRTLRQISDEYGISFDFLLKEDDSLIKSIDDTKRKMTTFSKVLIVLLAIITALIIGFFVMLHIAFQPTPDGKRINSDTTVRMLMDLPDATPSRAITFTTDKPSNDSGYEDIIKKYETDSEGGVEGDIPSVLLHDDPIIRLHFQDLNYNNVIPEKIMNVSADITNVISDSNNKETIQLTYEYDDGCVTIDPTQMNYKSDKEKGEVWYTVSIVVRYEVESIEYTSVTALTVFD